MRTFDGKSEGTSEPLYYGRTNFAVRIVVFTPSVNRAWHLFPNVNLTLGIINGEL